MKKRTLGRTKLEVSELSLGGLFVSKFGGDLPQSKHAVHRALELGINYIDTAPTYGDSEEVLGKCLEGVKQPFFLSTKLGGRPTPFDPRNKDCLRKSVEISLKTLGRDHIDVLYVHEPERPQQYDWWTDPENVYGPVLDVLDELKKSGVVRFTGLGGTTAYAMARLIRTGKFDVVLTAFNYALLWREAEHEILPAAKEHNVGIVIGSPLQQGFLAQRWDKQVRHGAPALSKPRREQLIALYDYLDEIKLPLPDIAIRWVISNPDISCVLTGARSQQEVEQNVAAVAKGPLPRPIKERLDAIAAMVPFRPCEESATIRQEVGV
jgi:aryl-alcohol dehydrogenase-like predicted oxidoreductase